MDRRARPVLVALLLVLGCRQGPRSAPAGISPAGESAPGGQSDLRGGIGPAGSAPASPLSQKQLPTTDGGIAVGNLEGDITNLVGMLGRQPKNAPVLATLALMYLEHGKICGRLAEYDRAEELARQAVELAPKEPRSWSALAAVHGRLHRFVDADDDLRHLEQLGQRGLDLERRRASLLVATGRLAEARPMLEKWAAEEPRIDTVGELACLHADEGKWALAEREFTAALSHYRQVSPFPVVWLWLQQGILWQTAGRPARARELFAAAHERMPADAAVTSHLAAMEAATGNRARAIALLRPLVASSDDPEYPAQLAELLAAAGEAGEAQALRTRAATRYDELLQKHREAFADHAARFYLAVGGQAPRVLALAEENLRLRSTPDAFALVGEAALAAAQPARACQVARQAVSAFPARTDLHLFAWKAFRACGEKERADSELRVAERLAREAG